MLIMSPNPPPVIVRALLVIAHPPVGSQLDEMVTVEPTATTCRNFTLRGPRMAESIMTGLGEEVRDEPASTGRSGPSVLGDP